jgi:hypothetical protein
MFLQQSKKQACKKMEYTVCTVQYYLAGLGFCIMFSTGSGGRSYNYKVISLHN